MEFEDSRDADDAVYELNGKELCGERVIVEHARGPRRDRDDSQTWSWEGMAGYQMFGHPKLATYASHFILEEPTQRLTKFQLHLLG